MSTTSVFFTRGRNWLLATSLIGAGFAFAAAAQDYGLQQPYPPQSGYGQPGDPSQVDPPSRVARISLMQGNVSLQPAGVEDFSPAGLNYPLTTGDRLYSDNGAVTELEAGQLAIRLGGMTDLSVTAMTDQLEQFGLGQGSIHVRSYDLDPNSTLEIDTPNVAVTVLAPGDLRVDVSPDGTTTQVTLLSGQARVDGQGFQQQLQPGESLQLTGTEPVYAQDVRRPRGDNLDRFSSDRDRAYQSAISVDSDYVSPDTIGAADLGQYGDWSNDGDSGPVWYPRGVAVDWQPYSVGHWAYIAPWGWTWVENEPWGFAPFHYGRWARFGPRWGWIPGPHVVRPVYSPALVAFVGGGVGVTAWFPLGPREAYTPWYRTSPLYANRINVTNIYNRNTVEVRNIYNQRTTNVYINNTTINNRVYVNRQVATVAIPQAAFAGGRPVRDVSMRVPPQQLANAPVLSRPNATPTRSIMAPAPAHVLPPHIDRPPVASRAPINNGGGFQPAGGNRPGGFGNGGGANNGYVQPNGGNRSGGFGNQAGAPNGSQLPTRGNPPAQPAQIPPTRGSASPVQPQPGEGRQGPPRTFEPNPAPAQYRPGPGVNAPGAGQPTTGIQAPARGSGEGSAPPLRGEPGRVIAPAPVAPSAPTQVPNRGNGDGQAPPLRGNPGRMPAPAPLAPTTQPQAPVSPGEGGREFRQPATAAPPTERVPQQPSSNVRVWQQPNQMPPQNRPEPPAQAPREVPLRVQSQPAPPPQRQIAPQPAPAARPPAPAPAPKENHPPREREEDKHK